MRLRLLFILLLFIVSACNNSTDNNKEEDETDKFYKAMKHIEDDMKESQKKTSEEWLKGYDTFTEYEVTPTRLSKNKTDKKKNDVK